MRKALWGRPGVAAVGLCLALGGARLALAAESEAPATAVPAASAASSSAPSSASPGRLRLLGDSLGRIPSELGRIFSYPFDEPAEFSKYALGVGLLIALDKPITRAYQDHVEQPLRHFHVNDAPPPFKNLGTGGTDGWLLLGISGSYLGGLVTDDTRLQKAGLASGKALAYSMIVSQALLKSVAGRKRPNPSLSHPGQASDHFSNNPYDFGHARRPTFRTDEDASSFPSFHFTAWFAVAKVYEQAYDNPWVPYGLLTLGLASDIQGHKHWVSDMTAGALIGTLIGRVVWENPGDKGKAGMVSAYWNKGPGLVGAWTF